MIDRPALLARQQSVRESLLEYKQACIKLGSHGLAQLMDILAHRLDHSTALGKAVLDWPGDPRVDGLPLRVACAVDALSRRHELPGQSGFAPSKEAEFFFDLIKSFEDDFMERLMFCPQINDVRRSAALFPAVWEVCRHFGPYVELIELGASAGLNLNMDRFRYELGGVVAGDRASPVVIKSRVIGRQPRPAAVEVISRLGVDRNPIDVRDIWARERISPFVCADQLEAAVQLALIHRPKVEKGEIEDWIGDAVVRPQAKTTTRLVFNSFTFQYLDESAKARVRSIMNSAGRQATSEKPLAWLQLEAACMNSTPRLSLQLWPHGQAELLGYAHPQGTSVSWRGRS